MDNEVLFLDGRQVRSLLDEQERRVVELVRDAYTTHSRGETSLPHSTFLDFPGMARERIIALPGFLGGDFEVAGLKWIASFPDNTTKGLDRASAVIVLNSLETGRPQAIMEGAAISAKRTAASAALAGRTLKREEAITSASFVGCGLINFEIARFLKAVEPRLKRFVLYDVEPASAYDQQGRLESLFPDCEAVVVESLESALERSRLVSFATTAVEPHVTDLTPCRPGTTILHISLRDLAAGCLLDCDNITDDVDHACRAKTSLHLAQELTGSRDFVRCTLGDVLEGAAPARASPEGIAVFSPFGLGVLDLAVAQWVARQAVKRRIGTHLSMFASSGAGQTVPAP